MKKRLNTKSKLVISLGSIFLVLCMGIIAVLSATKQTTLISSKVTFEARDVSCKVYYEFYHKIGDGDNSKNVLGATISNVTTGIDEKGTYFLITPDTTELDIKVADVKGDNGLKETPTTLPDGTVVDTSYVGYKLTIENTGSRDIYLEIDNSVNNDLDNLTCKFIYDLGESRIATRSNGFCVLNTNYDGDPGVNTGTALGSGSMEMVVYVTDASKNANLDADGNVKKNENISLPITLRAARWEMNADDNSITTVNVTKSSGVDLVSGVVKLYADDSTESFAEESLFDGSTSVANFNDGYKAVNVANAQLVNNLDIFSQIPSNTSFVRFEVEVENKSTLGALLLNVNFNKNNSQVIGVLGIDENKSTSIAQISGNGNTIAKYILKVNITSISKLLNLEFDVNLKFISYDSSLDDTSTASNFSYTENASGGYSISVNRANMPTDSISIPYFRNGRLVTEIADAGFAGVFTNGSMSISVALPESIKSIGANAFGGCVAVKVINLPEGLETIGASAFGGAGLTGELVLPSTLKSIGASAFAGQTGFTGGLVLPYSVSKVGESAFVGCSGLNGKLIWSENCQQIPNSCFSGCLGLSGILEIPLRVTNIGNNAFSSTGFTGLYLPSSCMDVGIGAFSGCSKLKDLVLASGAFANGGIKDNTFYGCTSLNNMEGLPYSATEIGNYAFFGCTGLAEIKIRSSVRSIGNHAFEGCVNANLTFEVINNGSALLSIGESAFEGCTSITEVNIPVGVNSIQKRAFLGCNNLISVIFTNSSGWYVSPEYNNRDLGNVVNYINNEQPRIMAEFLKSESGGGTLWLYK